MFGSDQPTFRQRVSYEKRIEEAQRILDKHPTCLPVIVQSTGIDIERHKYLVPASMEAPQFHLFLRKKIELQAHDALFSYVEKAKASDETVLGSVTLLPASITMGEMYAEHKHTDKFLYVYIERETTFG